MYRKKLSEAAESQLAGPFGKLGRYVLKTQWGIEVPARGKASESPKADAAGTGDVEGDPMDAATEEGRPGAGQGKSLLRRFKDFLGRFLSLQGRTRS
ncbi:MAG: hypothetical protein JXL84_17945 [Deltaproteobacteria bacterium]|nr:hypothetical protein [Deltaproteobacteria bacterium]